jgi:UDP-N-acetylglucosamine 2-epimerase (non-hydrolysing)
MKKRIHLIAAVRPDFMKIAPLFHALVSETWCEPVIVHTGQHYDPNMSAVFLREFKLPQPHFHLEVGSGSHAEQTGRVMVAYERIVVRTRPDWIVVTGDVNSTVAAALVGAKLGIPVAHLEAGLRSGDRRMPEEINRIATDVIADLLWTPSRDADAYLLAEGVPAERIELVGNMMIDSYEMLRGAIERATTRARLGFTGRDYGVVTLHRPSNVDRRADLEALVIALAKVAQSLPLVFAVHPRTHKMLEMFDLRAQLSQAGVSVVEPLGYIEFMNLVTGARAVITDSGGVQEETTYLGIPCLTLRENTERPVTVTEGSNRLVRTSALTAAVQEVLKHRGRLGRRPEFWDGQSARRAVQSLRRHSAAA